MRLIKNYCRYVKKQAVSFQDMLQPGIIIDPVIRVRDDENYGLSHQSGVSRDTSAGVFAPFLARSCAG